MIEYEKVDLPILGRRPIQINRKTRKGYIEVNWDDMGEVAKHAEEVNEYLQKELLPQLDLGEFLFTSSRKVKNIKDLVSLSA